jgi:hypothetical protein
MIVFDLTCTASHVFEAWFANSSAYEDQKARGLLMCPICRDSDVTKAVMAPAVPRKGNSALLTLPVSMPDATPVMSTDSDGARAAVMREMIGKIAEMQAESIKTSKWVGKDFAQQARAMDAGDQPHASIHGQTTPDEARALMEDGIAVMPLLVPVIPPEEQN